MKAGCVLALAFVLCAGGTGGAQSSEDPAIKGALAWLTLVDQGKYVESWQAAAPLFQTSVPQPKWVEVVSGARTPLGKLVSRVVKSATSTTSLPGAPDGKYVVIQFASTFEKKASATETVTPMQIPDGSWRVSGYYVR
jgi:hypothetical protein